MTFHRSLCAHCGSPMPPEAAEILPRTFVYPAPPEAKVYVKTKGVHGRMKQVVVRVIDFYREGA